MSEFINLKLPLLFPLLCLKGGELGVVFLHEKNPSVPQNGTPPLEKGRTFAGIASIKNFSVAGGF